jgi:hypothetical protein
MAGYSQTPLLKKLGMRAGMSVYIFQPPDHYWQELDPLPENVTILKTLRPDLDFIHLFAADQKTLFRELPKAKKNLAPDGMLWISWPKKSSGEPTDLDEKSSAKAGLTPASST